MIIHGDCIEEMAKLPAESVDAIVTDGPYGISFMNREWDQFNSDKIATRVEYDRNVSRGEPYASAAQKAGIYDQTAEGNRRFQEWTCTWAREALRVLKPGGYLLSFGGTRTFHRMTSGIEDAGFEIRDCIFCWLYGSGFPKSLNPVNNLWNSVEKCLKKENARCVVQNSECIQVRLPEGKERIALASVVIQPGDEPGLLMEIGRADGSCDLMVMLQSEWTENIDWNTILSWKSQSPVDCYRESTSITETELERTIGSQTLSYCLSLTTPKNTLRFETLPGGLEFRVSLAVRSLTDASKNTSAIPTLSVLGNATFRARTKRLVGTGTSLKPACEPVVVARKPLAGTVVENLLANGTGALNIDASRVGASVETWPASREYSRYDPGSPNKATQKTEGAPAGRWPANVILSHSPECELVGEKVVGSGERHAPRPGAKPFDDGKGWNQHSMTREGASAPDGYGEETVDKYACVPGCPVAELDRQSGEGKSVVRPPNDKTNTGNDTTHGHMRGITTVRGFSDVGGASRFFYIAKASRSERESGLWGLPASAGGARNKHPTVKPVALMRYLVKLVTPPKGTVLDPFMGSGTTGIACVEEVFEFIGIEREAEYVAIAKARIAAARAPTPALDEFV